MNSLIVSKLYGVLHTVQFIYAIINRTILSHKLSLYNFFLNIVICERQKMTSH